MNFVPINAHQEDFVAKITVKSSTFKKLFPKSMPVPPRLLAFAEWLRGVDHGTLGYFDVLAGDGSTKIASATPSEPRYWPQSLGYFCFFPMARTSPFGITAAANRRSC